ncbi:hypothetical protein HYC85_009990 [Camellia sinensis]|uniref:Uncharacterized protein n=1 Tax=Camellia sinensis TaxID=4442 RepID=A0A7J7HJF4_CAMSI|nr:hypothetical protein HYC85_009990 [Camellia sinensis]
MLGVGLTTGWTSGRLSPNHSVNCTIPRIQPWSKIADRSALNRFKSLQKLQTNRFCNDYVGSAEEDKLRCLFNHFLCILLKQNSGSDCFKPLPPMPGDEKSDDLFKFYFVVRERDGYESVFRVGFWCWFCCEIDLHQVFRYFG